MHVKLSFELVFAAKIQFISKEFKENVNLMNSHHLFPSEASTLLTLSTKQLNKQNHWEHNKAYRYTIYYTTKQESKL